MSGGPTPHLPIRLAALTRPRAPWGPQVLDVSRNRLRRLPPELGQLTRLQELELGGQQAGPSRDINGGTQVLPRRRGLAPCRTGLAGGRRIERMRGCNAREARDADDSDGPTARQACVSAPLLLPPTRRPRGQGYAWSTSPEVVRHVHNLSGSDPEAYRAGPVDPRLPCPRCLGQGRLDPGSHAAHQARPVRPARPRPQSAGFRT